MAQSPNFDVVHPHYRANAEFWQMAWDFYRGGDWVINPQRQVGKVGFWRETDRPGTDTGGIQEEPAHKRVRYIAEPVNSYLQSHVRESREAYFDRVSRAAHYPLFRSIVDIYVSAVLRTAPKRGDGASKTEPWLTYWDDVDLAGDSVDAFVRKALTLGIVFGSVYAVTDKPAFPVAAASKAHQLARGERAYSYLVTPLDLLDWCLDERGFKWVVLREPVPEERSPGEEGNGPEYGRRVLHRDGWEFYVKQKPSRRRDGQWVQIAGGKTGFGEVPFAPLWCRRSLDTRYTLDADPMLADMVHIDRSLFNLMSLQDEQLYGQCFSQLWIPLEPGASLPSSLDLGSSVAAGFNGEFGQPLMLSPDSSVLGIQMQITSERLGMARSAAQVSRGRAEYSKEERSADALLVESQDKSNQVASLAEHVEEFDRRLHHHVALWEGQDPASAPLAAYSRDINLKSLTARIADVVALSGLGLPIEAKRELVKPLAVQVMREQAVPDEIIQKVQTAIDKMEEPKPEFGFDGPGKPPFGKKPVPGSGEKQPPQE